MGWPGSTSRFRTKREPSASPRGRPGGVPDRSSEHTGASGRRLEGLQHGRRRVSWRCGADLGFTQEASLSALGAGGAARAAAVALAGKELKKSRRQRNGNVQKRCAPDLGDKLTGTSLRAVPLDAAFSVLGGGSARERDSLGLQPTAPGPGTRPARRRRGRLRHGVPADRETRLAEAPAVPGSCPRRALDAARPGGAGLLALDGPDRTRGRHGASLGDAGA